MKAWLIRENNTDGCEVVFAETRGKVRQNQQLCGQTHSVSTISVTLKYVENL